MRYFAAFVFTLLLLVSCKNDPSDNSDSGDSMVTINDNNFTDSGAARIDSNNTNQPAYDCSVLHRRVPNAKNQEAIRKDLNELQHCGVDSFDFLYVVPNLFPGWLSENQVQGIDSVTYGDFMKHLTEFRKSPAYYQLHERVTTLDSLRTVAYDAKRVYYMKPVLGKLGFTEPEWEMFLGFSRTYPVPKGNFTWGNMLDEFEKYSSKSPQ